MALEQRRIAEFHGKNLDETGIDPDGTIFYLVFLFVFQCLTSIPFCLIALVSCTYDFQTQGSRLYQLIAAASLPANEVTLTLPGHRIT